jgi:catechol 2,3-dioxygenase-like lactoylglutathione lyase family enzyme
MTFTNPPIEGTTAMLDIVGINHVSITVTDLERSVPWYTDLFGMGKLMDQSLADGSSYVLIGKPDFSMSLGLHIHPTNKGERFSEARTGLDHVSFLVPDRSDLDRWQERLRELDVPHSPISDQPGYSVLVFRDPDNIQLELFASAAHH